MEKDKEKENLAGIKNNTFVIENIGMLPDKFKML